MLKFLSAVWPKTGNYLVAHPYTNGGFNQVAFETIEQAAKQSEVWSKQGFDSYFAVGSVSSTGQGASRKSEVVKEFRTFILDIDCGDGKDYATQSEGLEALKTLINKLSLPKPILVSSGYGWHVYWTLTESITAAEWLPIAQKFKQVVAHAGLIADRTRTADRASVLRVPDTINYKRGAQTPVKVVKWGEPSQLSAFVEPIEEYAAANNIEAIVERFKPDDEAMAMMKKYGVVSNLGQEFEPADFEMILERCGAMRYCVEHNETLTEPLWRGALSVVKFCENGDELIHKVSENHPDYSESATEAKAEPISAPFTCAYMRDHCEACQSCTETCNSPISIGRVFQIVGSSEQSPIISIMPNDYGSDDESEHITVEGFLCDYPHPYKLRESGIITDVEKEDGGGTYKRTICPYPIKFIKRVHDNSIGEDIAEFHIRLPKDGWRPLIVAMREFADSKGGKVASELASMGCLIESKEQKLMGDFMSAYLRSVIAAAAASKSYSQLGWSQDFSSFVLPNKVVKSDGTVEDAMMSSKIEPIAKAMAKAGTLEDWLKVINVYSREGYEAYAFGHSVAYGSLLMRFTDYEGAVVNLLGDSGSGKSTVLRTINSVFGHPKDLLVQQRDNEVAKFIQIAAMHNISPCYDEISNIDAKELSDLCYGISQGRDKRRGGKDGGLRSDELTWCCLMVCTANHSLYERLGTLKSDASAEAMRVFEYHVRRNLHQMSKEEAQEAFEPLSENYGHAGEIFVSWMMQNQDVCKARVKHWFKRFDVEANVPSQERYWSAVVGATMAGAELSSKLGLNEFDIEKLFQFAVEQALSARCAVSENKRSPVELMVDFLNFNIRSTIVLGGGTLTSGKDTALWVKQEPSNGLLVRVEIDKNLAYVSKSAVKKWVTSGGGDYAAMLKHLRDKRVIINDNVEKVLSANSEVIKTGQIPCWMIDLAHREMSGGVSLQVVKMNKVEDVKKVVAFDRPF